MENNFLTDAELPATVADIKSLFDKMGNLISAYPSIANVVFSNSSIFIPKNTSGNSRIQLESASKKIRVIADSNSLLFQTGNIDDSNMLQTMVIDQNGNIYKIGGGSFSALSDERMKDNILPFTDGLNKVLDINPKSFQYKAVEGTPTENYPDFICNKTQYGVIAQELETVAPEMVSTGEDGFKSVDLSNLCLLLVNAVKEQNQMIIDLTARVEALENPTPQA